MPVLRRAGGEQRRLTARNLGKICFPAAKRPFGGFFWPEFGLGYACVGNSSAEKLPEMALTAAGCRLEYHLREAGVPGGAAKWEIPIDTHEFGRHNTTLHARPSENGLA